MISDLLVIGCCVLAVVITGFFCYLWGYATGSDDAVEEFMYDTTYDLAEEDDDEDCDNAAGNS